MAAHIVKRMNNAFTTAHNNDGVVASIQGDEVTFHGASHSVMPANNHSFSKIS